MTETEFINKKLRPWLKSTGFKKIHKITERFKSGWPDLICISEHGLTAYIEAKVHPNKITPIQRNELTEIALLGAPAYVFTWHPKSKSFFISKIDSFGYETIIDTDLFERWWDSD